MDGDWVHTIGEKGTTTLFRKRRKKKKQKEEKKKKRKPLEESKQGEKIRNFFSRSSPSTVFRERERGISFFSTSRQASAHVKSRST
ncbi:hypothetical protein HZU73_07518 [Apis mellifera caucasica]|nr:hypothetical protein HZU73_07518 [Apis mellifera caucasica]KAG9438057.1 hypothetical protein HZU67_01067 [Apis mellifera carnica]